VLAVPPAASSAPQAAATSVRIDAAIGFQGFARQGSPVPLRLLVESDGFFAGKLRIGLRTQQNGVLVERALEIPGGSRKQLDILLPRPDVADIAVRDRAGRIAGRASVNVETLTTQGLIGVLSTGPPPITHIDIPVVGDTARVSAISAEVLDLGAEALRGLSHLVVDSAVIPALSPHQIGAVLGYAELGGDLLVAAPSEAALGFLPTAWRGAGGGKIRRTNAGNGNVTVALTPLGDPAWSEGGQMWSRALRPADLGRWIGDDLATTDWLEALSASGRFRRATLGWLLAFVLGYVALVGPVNFIVLSRLKRRDLAWITVPALALLFAGGAYVAGHSVRSVPVVQGVGMVVVDGSGERDILALGMLSRSGGERHIKFPASWIAEPLGGFDSSGSPPILEPNRDGSDVTFRLSIGAFGTAIGRRVHVGTSSGAGTLRVLPGQYEGTVVNPMKVRLRGAGVFVGNSFASIGTMEPGAAAKVTVISQPQPDMGLEQPLFNSGGDPNTYQAVIALLQRARLSVGLGDPGRAYLIGVADLEDLTGGFGIARTIGTMVVLSPISFSSPAGAEVPSGAIPRSVVATDGQIDPSFGPFLAIQNSKRSVLRFELPGRTAKSFTLSTVGLDQFGIPPFGKGLIGPDGPVLIGPNGVPVPAPTRGDAQGPSIAVYDFKRGAWHAVTFKDGKVSFGRAAAAFVSADGDLLVQVASDFGQTFAPAMLELTGVFS